MSGCEAGDADRRERSNRVGGDTVAGVEALTEVPTQEEVWQLAALDRGSFDDTALLFRRGEAFWNVVLLIVVVLFVLQRNDMTAGVCSRRLPVIRNQLLHPTAS